MFGPGPILRMPMRAVAIIPARVGSNRFPGKVLAAVEGRPLVVHVWERVQLAESISEVLVATDSEEVARVIESVGGNVVRTEGDYATGSDRVASVAMRLDADIIVNVQADNGDLVPATIDAVVAQFDRDEVRVVTPVAPFPADQSVSDPSRVKAVVGLDGKATRFTRKPVSDSFLHIGVYGFRPDVLQQYASWKTGRLEREEQLEQLRFIENGVPIHTVVVEDAGVGVDTPGDLNILLTKLSSGHEGQRF